jgi:DNA-directed RNA polymerase subunit M/transcription elongation factor TFIIS
MRCPKCKGYMRVTRTINKTGKVFRYRKCNKCGYSIKTTEIESYGWNYKSIVDEIKRIVDEVK